MSRILCIWELGEDLSYLAKFSQVVDELLQKGHDVFFAVKDLADIESFSWDKRVKFLQAPVWQSRSIKPGITHCFAEILLLKGFHSTTTLRPMVRAWLQLYEIVKPELIIFDHAPTALLAAKGLSQPKIILSNCYVTPPPGTPPVDFRHWDPAPSGYIDKKDIDVVQVINHVSAFFSLPKIQYVSDLFLVDRSIFPTYAELDFYKSTRIQADYIGAFLPTRTSLLPAWPLSSLKIFVYLKYGREQVETVLKLLGKSGAQIVCFCSGASAEFCQKYQSSTVTVSSRPFDMQSVLREADVVACHAGQGMVTSCLQIGKPLILLPTQLEQRHTSSLIEKLGIGIVIDRSDSEESTADQFNRFFSSPSYAENAKRFAFEHRNINPYEALSFISNTCAQLLCKY